MILTKSTLSFLGLGVEPPTPSWGSMIADRRDYLAASWWVSLFPGLAFLAAILGINLLADWLRERLDPKWGEQAVICAFVDEERGGRSLCN